ncbi:uncharacterized protein C16orf96 homolog [Rhynchocyon petersi]
MSFSLTFKELVSIAIPVHGVVNFQALHMLLQGILEHINMADLKKVLSGEEDFLQASPGMFMPREGDAQPTQTPMKRIHNIFDHVVSRIDKIESQVAELNDIPASLQILESSQGSKKPIQDLWNIIKIRKMVEGNEEATSKAMQILQELLNDLTSVKVTTNTLKKEIEKLKDHVEKINMEKIDAFFDDFKRQNRKLTSVQRELTTLQDKVSTFPKVEELVLWSSLHEAMFPGGIERRPGVREQDSLLQIIKLQPAGPSKAEEPIQGTETMAPPPATELGSAWPQALQPHKPRQTGASQLQALEEQGEELYPYELSVPQEGSPQETPLGEASPKEAPLKEMPPREVASKDMPPREVASKDMPSREVVSKVMTPRKAGSKIKPPREVPSREVPPKSPRTALQRMKVTAALAVAAAAAYAAAANSAARAAKAAAQAINDAPASKLASLASSSAASGALGVLAEDLGAGTTRGATHEVTFKEEAEVENDYYPSTPESSDFSAALPTGIRTSIATPRPASQAMSPEEKKEVVRNSMSHIAALPAKHDSMKEEFAQLSTKLQQRLNYMVTMGSKSNLGNTVEILQEKVSDLQKSRMKEEELERIWGNQIQMMKDHYIVLDRSMEKLQIRLDEFKTLQAQIKKLEMSKVDKISMEQELKEKADRSALASKASRADLETVVMELNELMHGMLLKVTNYEEDWKKSFEQLSRDMGTKLVQGDLDNLKKEVEDVWKTVRRLLIEGLRFDPDSAAGFRKKLFERVKCISCDRPVEMMTGPHLITIRKPQQLSGLRPASADSYEYLHRQHMKGQQHLQFQGLGDPEGSLRSLDPQQDWGDAPHNTPNLGFKTYSLSTIYPYGDPHLLDYDTAEVDILGVDGILYKGRMNNPMEARPTAPTDKEPGGETPSVLCGAGVETQIKEYKVFVRKFWKANGKSEWNTVEHLTDNKSIYKLGHIIKERYPTFIDALRDLDNDLSICFLFSTFPLHRQVPFVKVPRPPSRNLYDRVRTSALLRAIYPALYDQTSTSTVYSSHQMVPSRPPSLPPLPLLPPLKDPHQAPRGPRHTKTLRFESLTNSVLKEEPSHL